jgi:hypothetical protein
MRKLVVGTVVAALLGIALARPALAGPRERYLWQGFAIGLGSAILLDHLLRPSPAVASPAPPVAYPPLVLPPPPAPQRWIPGHYEDRWVPTTRTETVWVPAFYDYARGAYVHGHYETRAVPGGYWIRVWIEGRWGY